VAFPFSGFNPTPDFTAVSGLDLLLTSTSFQDTIITNLESDFSGVPTLAPTRVPTMEPSLVPTESAGEVPTIEPSRVPTMEDPCTAFSSEAMCTNTADEFVCGFCQEAPSFCSSCTASVCLSGASFPGCRVDLATSEAIVPDLISPLEGLLTFLSVPDGQSIQGTPIESTTIPGSVSRFVFTIPLTEEPDTTPDFAALRSEFAAVLNVNENLLAFGFVVAPVVVGGKRAPADSFTATLTVSIIDQPLGASVGGVEFNNDHPFFLFFSFFCFFVFFATL